MHHEKSQNKKSMILLSLLAFALIGCQVPIALVSSPIVSVAPQSGALSAIPEQSTTYAISTMDITDGTGGSFSWFADANGTTNAVAPTGVLASVSAITGNSATATMRTDGGIVAGTYYFKLTEGSAVSPVATLTVTESGATPTVTVSNIQVGKLVAGGTTSASISVTTTNVTDGTAGSFTWYSTAAGTTVAAPPTGLLATVSAVAGNAATITFTTTEVVVAGTYYYKLSEAGVLSPTKSISVAARYVSVGSQTGTITAGNSGSASFPVSVNFTTSAFGSASVTWCDSTGNTLASQPTNLSATTSTVPSATLTISADDTVAAGDHYFKLTVDSVSSALRSVLVSSESVTVGNQSAAITEGTAGSATFLVSTNAPTGTVGTIAWYSDSAGTISASQPTWLSDNVPAIASSMATITLSASSSSVAGSYYFKVTEHNAVSPVKTLTIAPSPTVSVGLQSKNLYTGNTTVLSFPITTTNISNGTSCSVTWYSDAAGTTATTRPSWIDASSSVTSVSSNAATFNVNVSTVLDPGPHYFRVTAGGAVSPVAALTVILKTPSINAVKQTGQIYVYWSGISDATSYLVYRSSDGSQGSLVKTITGSPPTPGYWDSSVTTGTTYYYTVFAQKGLYASAASNQASATY